VQIVVDEVRVYARGIKALEANAYFLMSLKVRLCPKMEGLRKAKKEGWGSRRDVVIEGGGLLGNNNMTRA
jgi:hypothetical protein